jgi:hypothetical protein
MEQDEKDLLQKTYDLSKENNKILHSIRNSNRWANFFRFIYWVLIIGVSLGAFYYLQPYVNNILGAYNSIQGDLNTVKTVSGKIPSVPNTTTK